MSAPAAHLLPRTEAQAEASRRNGALSRGPATPEGKARSALNGTRHGLCSARFFLLPDEDPEAFALFVADHVALLQPRDAAEHRAAERSAQARWRQMRADRLEAEILAELFAAKGLTDAAEARAVRAVQTQALATLIRYRARLQRDDDRALADLADLRRRRLAPAVATAPTPAPAPAARTSEPELPPRPEAQANPPAPESPVATLAWNPPPPNRHERRRLMALERRAA